MSDRGRLSMNKLYEFKLFLIDKGFDILPSKGVYEVLRVSKDGNKVLFHKRDKSNHATASFKDGGSALISKFLRRGRR